MNDAIFKELEDLVERTLRPVWASRSRKELLRMELLAYVMDVFAEEYAASGDERVALKVTLRRFGLAEVVGNELQASLGFTDRWLHFLFKGNLMAAWLWSFAVIAIFSGPALIMPALALYRKTGELTIVPLLIGMSVTLAGLVLAGYGIKQRIAHS